MAVCWRHRALLRRARRKSVKCWQNVPRHKGRGNSGSDIPGLYEVEAGSNIIYFILKRVCSCSARCGPGTAGTSPPRRTQDRAAKLKDVPLDKAVKIGNGRNKVIEFTDPDCPYCRKAAEFFKGRDDVTLYIFFFPLPIHKDAEAHAR